MNDNRMIKKDVLDYLMWHGYNNHNRDKRRVVREFGGGKSFHYRGEQYDPSVVTQGFYRLTAEERTAFAVHVEEWEFIEDEQRRVKQHFINYLNECKTIPDIYNIIPDQLDYSYNVVSEPQMPPKRFKWYKKSEQMELYLDRLFIARLD